MDRNENAGHTRFWSDEFRRDFERVRECRCGRLLERRRHFAGNSLFSYEINISSKTLRPSGVNID